MPKHRERTFGIARLLSGELTALALLLRLGSEPRMSVPLEDLGTWLRSAPPDEVLVAGLRLAALALATALVVLTLAGAAARLTGAARAVRWLDRATPRLLRRALDGAAVLSLAAAIAPAAVSLPPVIRDGRAVESLPAVVAPAAPPAPAATGAPLATPVPAVATPTAATPAPMQPVESPRSSHHIVVAGEHLWSVAAHRVAELRGVDVSTLAPAEVAPYWRIVCDLNRPRLVSGDPDIVYPGEELELPPLPS